MNWLEHLFVDTGSVAHIVLLYSLVISVGVLLGKIKVGGISLGVTFVLFAGIIVGHVYTTLGIVDPSPGGYACPASVLNFLQDFGLLLFVYFIGLQVGPGFFESFKRGGIQMNLVTVCIVFLNIAVMLGCYYAFFDTGDPENLPMMVGVLCGAVTNTPGLGAAQEALKDAAPALKDLPIAAGYACAYPLGVLGIIGATIALRFICRIKPDKEEEEIRRAEENNPHAIPHRLSLVVQNEALVGKSMSKVREFLSREFVCTHIKRADEVFIPKADTVLAVGDELNITCAQDDADAITAFIGTPIEVDWQAEKSPSISRRIVVTRSEVNGKTFGEMHFDSVYGVNVTRITRSGMELFASRQLRLQIGDRLMVVGPEDAVNRVTRILGNSVKRLDHPNIASIFVGILVGIVFGSIPFAFPGIPNPVRLGLAGGPLIIAILAGCYGYKFHLVTYTTTSANLLLREVGLVLFLASVGIKAGAGFWQTVAAGDGLWYVLYGFLITVVPILIMGIVARVKYKMNYFMLMGLIAGTNTDPPALAFANASSTTSAPAVGYSTVYPLAMFLRILTAQIIILFLCA